MGMLEDKTVQAVFTDKPLLSFFANAYALPSAYVSPVLGPNPFSFAYPAGFAAAAVRGACALLDA